MRPAAQVFTTPVIGVVCFAVILANWFGGVRYFRDVPGGLVAIAVGTVIAWGSTALGLGYGDLTLANLGASVSNFGFSVPIPAVGYTFDGFKYLGVILVTAIPFGIYDLIEALDNVESAAAAGDSFPTTQRADRRRRDQPDRLPDGQSVHQRGLYRPSRLEGDGRAHRLLRRDRHHHPGADLVRHHRGHQRVDPGRRDPADPAVHRHADRLAGVPGIAAPACAGDRAGAAAADRRMGQDA